MLTWKRSDTALAEREELACIRGDTNLTIFQENTDPHKIPDRKFLRSRRL